MLFPVSLPKKRFRLEESLEILLKDLLGGKVEGRETEKETKTRKGVLRHGVE